MTQPNNEGDQRRIEQEHHINETDIKPLGGLPKSPLGPLKEESFLITFIVTVNNDKTIEFQRAHSDMCEVLVKMQSKKQIVRWQTAVTQVINRGHDAVV
jgi:hypothetical protein